MHLKNFLIVIISLFLASSTAEANSLRGSKESLLKQRRMIKHLRLPIIRNNTQLGQMIVQRELYELPREGETFCLDPKIGECDPMHAHLYRTASPLVVKFLGTLSRDFFNRFGGKRLKVTSLVRTVEYQKKLQRRNRNAAKISHSAHLTGAAIDISYKEMTAEEMNWMRNRLTLLERERIIEATEERFQACFHIMVFKK